MPNFLGPHFARLNYQSSYGPHSMTISTLAWDNAGGDYGQYDTWAAGTVLAEDQWNDLVDVLLPFFPSTVTFTNWTQYYRLNVDNPATVVMTGDFTDKDGTSVSPGWTQAVQHSFAWKTTLGNVFKIVLLDAVSNNDFTKGVVPGAGDGAALHAVVTGTAYGISGRDNARPNAFLSETRTLNEALRRAYRMA